MTIDDFMCELGFDDAYYSEILGLDLGRYHSYDIHRWLPYYARNVVVSVDISKDPRDSIVIDGYGYALVSDAVAQVRARFLG